MIDLSWTGARHFVTEHVVTRLAGPSSECLSAIHALLDFLSQRHAHQFPRLLNTMRTAKKVIETLLSREQHSQIMDVTVLSAMADDE